MSDVNLVLRSTRVITPEGTRPAAVAVADGKIAAVLPYEAEVPAGARLEDFGDDVLLPGIVDTHVHVNDPGRTEWEGFWTATRAAAAGGITTLVDMPLNSLPPTTTVENLRIKQEVAASKAHIDTGFWGGALPDNVKDLAPLHEAGVFGFKAFLSPSGVEEFPELDQAQLERSLAEIAGFDGLMIIHAEDPHELDAAPHLTGPKYADYLATRPQRLRERRDRGPHRRRQADRRPRPRPAPVLRRRAAPDRRRQARGRTPHRRDLPALPHPDGRGSPGRGERVQVLPADPRGRQPGPAVGRRSPTAPSTASSPTTRPPPPTSRPTTSPPPGAASPVSSSASPRSGPRPASAATPWRTSSAGCRPRPRTWSG